MCHKVRKVEEFVLVGKMLVLVVTTGLLTRCVWLQGFRPTAAQDAINLRGSVLQQFQSLRDALARGLRHPDVVAMFIMFSAFQAVLCIVAWLSSSGYEDSSIPYLLQAILALFQLSALGWIGWKAWKATHP